MAWTQTDLQRLQDAIATGVRRVTFADGRSTEYHSLDQMLAAVDAMKVEIAGAASASSRRSRRIIVGRVGRYR
jgi:hypothetical protein